MRKELVKYILSVDLGKAQDPTAIVLNRRVLAWTIGEVDNKPIVEKPVNNLVYLKRFPLHTDYVEIQAELKRMCLDDQIKGHVRLMLDATGVGVGIIDNLRAELRDVGILPYGVMITAGRETRADGAIWYVPKLDLVTAVRIPLEENRLLFAADLDELDTLKDELGNFQVKNTTAGNEVFLGREGKHDDIVLAAAIACWWGEKYEPKAPPTPPPSGALVPEAWLEWKKQRDARR